MSSPSYSITDASFEAASTDGALAHAAAVDEARFKLSVALGDYLYDKSEPAALEGFLAELIEFLGKDKLERRHVTSKGGELLCHWQAVHAHAAKFEEFLRTALIQKALDKVLFKHVSRPQGQVVSAQYADWQVVQPACCSSEQSCPYNNITSTGECASGSV